MKTVERLQSVATKIYLCSRCVGDPIMKYNKLDEHGLHWYKCSKCEKLERNKIKLPKAYIEFDDNTRHEIMLKEVT